MPVAYIAPRFNAVSPALIFCYGRLSSNYQFNQHMKLMFNDPIEQLGIKISNLPGFYIKFI